LRFLNALTAHLGPMLVHYGGWGLFAINFLDSSILTFPLINDVLLIHLASENPSAAPLYALEAAAGSVLGAFVVYGIARGGRHVFGRKRSDYEVTGARHWLERNDLVTMLVASLLPPPAPFKVFPFAAGALRMKTSRFLVALWVGRSVRFVLEAIIGLRYGAQAEAYLRAHLPSVSVSTIVLIVLCTAGYRWLVGRG
jgi:membrane protein YqaA with SNARE-associated domain